MERVSIADLDANDAPPFRHEVASFQVHCFAECAAPD